MSIGCPNSPTGSLVFLQEQAESMRSDLGSGIRLNKGELWKEQGKEVVRTPSKLKPKFVRWLDFLNKHGKLSL